MDDKLAIKLKIIDRYYPLRIDWKDEEKLRGAAKKINDIVLKFKQRYADKDNQDLLAMATLQFVTKLMDLENANQSDTLSNQLESICEELDEFIKTRQ